MIPLWLPLVALADDPVPAMLTLAAESDDLSALSARLSEIPIEAVEASDPLRLLAGRREIAAGDDVAALVWLAPVRPTSVFGMRAGLEVAEIHLRAGRSREAIKAYRSVARVDTTAWPRRDRATALQDRAILGMAGVYVSLGKHADALEYLALIGHDSLYAPEAVAAKARVVLGQGDALRSLGLLADLRRPPRRWTADAEVVEVLGLLDACPTREPAWRRLRELVEEWAPIAEEVRAALEMSVLSPGATIEPDPSIPDVVVDLALRDHELRVLFEPSTAMDAGRRRAADLALADGLAAELIVLDRSIAEARLIVEEIGAWPGAAVVYRHAPPSRKTRSPPGLVRDRGEEWADEIGRLVADPAKVCVSSPPSPRRR